MDWCNLWQGVFTETRRRLEQFQRRVREGVGVEEAQDFARWVRNSGIGDLMAKYPPQSEALRRVFDYDGPGLVRMARELETACCQYYVGRTKDSEGTASGANKSDLEAIDRKLAVLVVAVDNLQRVKGRRLRRPALRVIKGKAAA